ncbi:hypothetical protein K458DRAFT_115650 [Lentithecium fluviatile CBS 122367]|uniref:Leucine-rich repeat domain-containing protein n=1 Tax=Lentithecium fluviatile CBS 122367 TaxID=1168545 RepID=A0A6G1INT4_9PLEO|nr:hypothetical protein K458DRAFT_115650 [Lentithecium fluviatile CBS 122367]
MLVERRDGVPGMGGYENLAGMMGRGDEVALTRFGTDCACHTRSRVSEQSGCNPTAETTIPPPPQSGKGTMSPSDFRDLPNELVLEALGHLLPIRGFLWSLEAEAGRREENARRVKALHDLTLTSRRLNALTTPLLYHSVIRASTQWLAPLLFLRTVMENPLTIHQTQYIEIQEGDLGAVPRADVSLEQVWAELLALGTWHHGGWTMFDGSVSILVTLANNATELALEGMHSAHILLGGNHFARLRCLWLKRPRYFDGAADITVSSPLVANRSPVSTFTRLHGTAFGGWEGLENLPEVDPVEVVDLTLDNCNLAPFQIYQLLKASNPLKRFSCRWKNRPMEPNAFPINRPPQRIELEELRRDLGRSCHSLEHLELDTLESSWQVSLDEEIPTIGDLRDFTVLKHLDVSGLVLWSDGDTADHPPLASILPASLETLKIHVEWDDYVEDGLMALSKDAPSYFPYLRSVDCSWRPASSHVAPLLIDMFAAVGIELKLSIAEDA